MNTNLHPLHHSRELAGQAISDVGPECDSFEISLIESLLRRGHAPGKAARIVITARVERQALKQWSY